jgi:ATP-dependent RNA helicase DDX35
LQDVFIIPEGAPGALAELERRKFTAEEGVSRAASFLFQTADLHH